MTPEQISEQFEDALDEAAISPASHGEHAQRMRQLRRHVAGKLASEINHRLGGEQLSAWDVLDIVQRWQTEMAAEFGKSCLLSGRARG